MYFKKFPVVLYSLDNKQSYQAATDIFRRIVLSYATKTKRSAYNLYDVVDGETPEIVAHKFYKNTNYHWIILHANEIIDPRFDWVLSQPDLVKLVKQRYGEANVYAIHHYETIVNAGTPAEQILMSNVPITGQEITGNINISYGRFPDPDNHRNIGTAQNPEYYYYYSKDPAQVSKNNYKEMYFSTSVSNFEYEDRLNEKKRRIKVIVPELAPTLSDAFTKLIKEG